MRRLLLAVATIAFALAGCTSSSNSAPTTTARVTGLAPCPAAGQASTATHRLPDLTLPCLGTAGGAVALRTLTGTPTVLNLYASWCGPCQQELPGFVHLAGSTAGRLRVIGVDTEDTVGSAGNLLAHAGVHYPSVYDEEGKLLVALNGAGLPMTVAVDAHGDIAAIHRGQLSEPELIKLVADTLGVHVT